MLPDPVHINVIGYPVAKARARVTRRGTYTPQKTRDWEKRAQQEAMVAMVGRRPLVCPVIVEITAVFAIPASWPKWKKHLADRGLLAHTSKPDGDNIAKAAKDAMNGIVWHDDAQVVTTTICKAFGNIPGVMIHVEPIDAISSTITTRPKEA